MSPVDYRRLPRFRPANTNAERRVGIGWYLFEDVDGPRYCEAVREAGRMRSDAYCSDPDNKTVPHPHHGAFSWELDFGGVPYGWYSRD